MRGAGSRWSRSSFSTNHSFRERRLFRRVSMTMPEGLGSISFTSNPPAITVQISCSNSGPSCMTETNCTNSQLICIPESRCLESSCSNSLLACISEASCPETICLPPSCSNSLVSCIPETSCSSLQPKFPTETSYSTFLPAVNKEVSCCSNLNDPTFDILPSSTTCGLTNMLEHSQYFTTASAERTYQQTVAAKDLSTSLVEVEVSRTKPPNKVVKFRRPLVKTAFKSLRMARSSVFCDAKGFDKLELVDGSVLRRSKSSFSFPTELNQRTARELLNKISNNNINLAFIDQEMEETKFM